MKYLGILLYGLLLCGTSYAQTKNGDTAPTRFSLEKSLTSIAVTLNHNASELVNSVFRNGECFETYNPETTGDDRQIGTFSNGSTALGMADGIILSTGLAEQAEGPNNFSFTLYEYNLVYTDPDIATLAGNDDIYDVAVLEFDFRPTSEEISFEYVFASEEYCEIVSPGFNDVFGFFISGPGINGPFSGNAENIARVPNSSQVVSVSSINHFTNSLYYRNNTPASFGDACSNGMAVAPDAIEFDGMTTLLTARSPVVPCQTYHLKIVIADIGDALYDSAIFLNAGSFEAGLINVDQENLGTVDSDDQVLVEGCGRSQLIFSRVDPDLSSDLWVRYAISPLSTAEEGVDFEMLPDSFLIAAGKFRDTLTLQSIPDGVPEGDESIFLYIENSCDCQGAFIELTITDPPPLQSSLPPTLNFCASDSLLIGPSAGNGVPPYSFTWSDGSMDSTFLFSALQDAETVTVSVTDGCGQQQVHDIAVAVDSVTASLAGTYYACAVTRIPVVLQGAQTYTVELNRSGTLETLDNITSDTLWLTPNGAETITLLAVSGDGCRGSVSGSATVLNNDIQVDSLVSAVSCFGAADGSIRVEIGSVPGPYTYSWSVPGLEGNDIQNLAPGSYRVTISDATACQYSYGFTVAGPDSPLSVTVVDQTPLTCAQDASVSLNAIGGTGSYSFNWADGPSGAGRSFTTAGTYLVTVTDANGCQKAESVEIEADLAVPVADIAANYVLDCSNPVLGISPTTIEADHQYRWLNNAGDTIGTEALLELSQPGNYRLVVRDPANGCSTERAFAVADDQEEFVITFEQNQILTCREAQTDLLAQFTDPPADLVLSWSGAAGPLGAQNPVSVELSDGPLIVLESFSPTTGCRQLDTFSLIADTLAPLAELIFSESLSCLAQESELSVTNPSIDWRYRWTTSDGNLVGPTDAISVRANQSGQYRVEITDESNGCSQTSSLELAEDYRRAEALAGPDRNLNCLVGSTEFPGMALPGDLPHRYRWLDLNGGVVANTATLLTATPATYVLEVSHAISGCLSYDTTRLIASGPEMLELAFESAPCAEVGNVLRVVEVAGGVDPYRYQLVGQSDFQPGGEWAQVPAGRQTVIVQDANGCTFSQSITVVAAYEELRVTVPPVTARYGIPVDLKATVNRSAEEMLRYRWTDPDSLLSCTDCAVPTLLNPQSSTTLLLQVSDGNGCAVTVPVFITVDRRVDAYAPTAIYPASDRAANRSFTIFGSASTIESITEVSIYNRWGGQVFHRSELPLNDPAAGWDGRIGNQLAPAGVYPYRYEITFRDGRKITQAGHFTLLR